MDVVLKRGTANQKLTGGTKTPKRVRDTVWVVNPLGVYDTCPTTCAHLPMRPFSDAVEAGLPVSDNPTHACYANSRVKLQAVKGEHLSWDDCVDVVIANIPHGGMFRWAEVGDIMESPNDIVDGIVRIRTERPDVTVIAYTHAWSMLGANERAQSVFRASCETIMEVTLARSLGWRAAITVPENWTAEDAVAFGSEHGKTFVCPAAQGHGSCITCRACDDSDNHVAFPAHGIRKRHAGKGI